MNFYVTFAFINTIVIAFYFIFLGDFLSYESRIFFIIIFCLSVSLSLSTTDCSLIVLQKKNKFVELNVLFFAKDTKSHFYFLKRFT